MPILNRDVINDSVMISDCRLREALRAMRAATPQKQEWMRAALFKELVSICFAALYSNGLFA